MTSTRSIRMGTDAYRELLDELEACGSSGECRSLLLAGGTEEDVQQLLADVSEATTLSVHQVDARRLMGERGIQTQGNLREVFDSTTGDSAVLVFNHLDVLLQDEDEAPQAETPTEDDDTLRPIDYLFDRIDACSGAVVLHAVDQALASGVADQVDVVIEP